MRNVNYTHTKEDVINEARAIVNFAMNEVLTGLTNRIKNLTPSDYESMAKSGYSRRCFENKNMAEALSLVKTIIEKEFNMIPPKENVEDLFLETIDKEFERNRRKETDIKINKILKRFRGKIHGHDLFEIEKSIFSLQEDSYRNGIRRYAAINKKQ